MPRIETLHWCEFEGRDGCQRFAIWPEPLDHDACFAEAGFTGFADSDARWDADFASIVDAAIADLSQFGPARLVAGEPPVGHSPAGRASRLSLTIQCAATDDQFPRSCVAFGEPPKARIATSDGHPILWLSLPPSTSIVSHLNAISSGRKTQATELDWSHLPPAV